MKPIAEKLIQSLYALGVRYAFGIPGGPSIPYLEAMRNNGIQFVTVANEQSAAMMADVFGRLTGIPGVCHATFGPGATNLSTGIGGALLDRSPVLAFTTEVSDADRGRRIQMNVDHQAIFRPITKWTTRLAKDNFDNVFSKAVEIATAENPGPVHIGLPVHIEADYVETNDMTFAPHHIPFPNQTDLEKVKKLLEKSKRPVIAAGLTAMRHGVRPLLMEFLNKNNIPVVITPMAKGIIPESHPCYAGVLFHAQSSYAAAVYSRADLVIGLGYDSIEFNYEAWMPDVPLIHIDTEPVDIPPEYEVAGTVIGRIDRSLTYLTSLDLPGFTWDLEEIQANKARMFRALMPETKTFNPADAVGVLQQAMPKGSILTSDVGAHLHLLGQLWKTEESARLLMTNGWSTMGFGIPAAIGAKLCKPENTVVCVTGDGGFLMNCGELLMARRLGIHVVVIVFVDTDYSLIKVKQHWKQVVPYATQVCQGEYFAADKFLGVPVLPARDQGEMKRSLQKALGMSGPVIIEAAVDGAIYQNLIVSRYK